MKTNEIKAQDDQNLEMMFEVIEDAFMDSAAIAETNADVYCCCCFLL